MMQKLSEQDLRALIEGGESNTVELKIASPRPVEMAERLCGMANAQGGVVIVGVEDAERKIVGVPAERIALTIDVILRAARRIIKPMLTLDPPEPEIYEVDGKRVVVVTIPPAQGTVHQIGGVFWARRGTCTVPLDMWELLELINNRGIQDWERQRAPNTTIEDLDLDKVAHHLSQRAAKHNSNKRFSNIEQALFGMNCATLVDHRVVPTNAGILFFGKIPQQHIAQSEVVCVLRPDVTGTSKYADLRIIRGTIRDLIDGTEKFLKEHISLGKHAGDETNLNTLKCSLEALREAVINAVVHRDYSKHGESIRVICYTDRIEVRSPGLLLPGITTEMLHQGNMFSKLRNPVIANLLRDIPGYMERIGSGAFFMAEKSRESDYPAPQFQEANEFIVTFRKSPRSSLLEQEHDMNTTGEKDHATLITYQLNERNNRLVRAIEYVSYHGHITNRAYRGLVGVTDKTALQDLSILVKRGALKRVGKGRGQEYKLP